MTVSLWIHLLIIIWIHCLKKHEQQKLGRGFQCRNYGSCGVFSLNWCLIQQRAFTLPVNAKPSMNGSHRSQIA